MSVSKGFTVEQAGLTIVTAKSAGERPKPSGCEGHTLSIAGLYVQGSRGEGRCPELPEAPLPDTAIKLRINASTVPSPCGGGIGRGTPAGTRQKILHIERDGV